MSIQSNIKTGSLLLGGILVAYLLSQLTGHILFSWIAMSKLIWLSMKFYWLSICLIAYWYDKEPIPTPEKIILRPKTNLLPNTSTDRTILQITQQPNEEASKWN